MFTKGDIAKLIKIIPKGMRHAITAKEIARILGYSEENNQVKTRELIDSAIDNGNIILSSTREPRGYWLSTDKQETMEYITSLKSRAGQITDRATNLQTAWNKKNSKDSIL